MSRVCPAVPRFTKIYVIISPLFNDTKLSVNCLWWFKYTKQNSWSSTSSKLVSINDLFIVCKGINKSADSLIGSSYSHIEKLLGIVVNTWPTSFIGILSNSLSLSFTVHMKRRLIDSISFFIDSGIIWNFAGTYIQKSSLNIYQSSIPTVSAHIILNYLFISIFDFAPFSKKKLILPSHSSLLLLIKDEYPQQVFETMERIKCAVYP